MHQTQSRKVKSRRRNFFVSSRTSRRNWWSLLEFQSSGRQTIGLIVFIDEGAKVNAVYYTESVLENGLLPDIRRISGDRLQQDGARSHSARHTIQFLDQHVPAYIEPEHWPANSPDLNPVDYRIWGALQQRVYYNTKIEDLNDLRREIVRAWDEISQRFVNAAIDQWCHRLRACVDARGGHFEHLFWFCHLLFSLLNMFSCNSLLYLIELKFNNTCQLFLCTLFSNIKISKEHYSANMRNYSVKLFIHLWNILKNA